MAWRLRLGNGGGAAQGRLYNQGRRVAARHVAEAR
jgi:hypothetical protein